MIPAGGLTAATDLWPLLWVSDGGNWPCQYFYFNIYRYLPSFLPLLYIYSTYLQQLSVTWIICSPRSLASSDKSKKINISSPTGSQPFKIYFEMLLSCFGLLVSLNLTNFSETFIRSLHTGSCFINQPHSDKVLEECGGDVTNKHFSLHTAFSSSLKTSTCQYPVWVTAPLMCRCDSYHMWI